ncbi:MAG: tRNA lysidine(34) synthetase TilS [Faecalibacterium sp.]|nr:tRNA lysidine(34) synthetase TilS [Faecalibacterium sp.]
MNNHSGETAAQLKTRIEESVLAHCGQAGLFAPAGGQVVVAVSGGADSMALLRILLALQEQLHITVTACHVNHGLRGAEADRDEAFVRSQCEQLQVPLTVCRLHRGNNPPPKNPTEEWARRLRYACFERMCTGPNTVVATAHTLTDQAETLLFRLARGTGPHGAAGIPAKRGCYVRPLLSLTRQDTENYCAAVDQPYITDGTNDTDAYARNRLRHHALPALQSVNEGAQQNIGRFCRKMARIDQSFARCADELMAAAAEEGNALAGPWALPVLQAADPLILEAALHRLLQPMQDVGTQHIANLIECVCTGRGRVRLAGGVWLQAGQGKLWLHREVVEKLPRSTAVFPLAPGEYSFAGGRKLKIEVFSADNFENTPLVHKKDLKNMADYAKISLLYPVLRTRQAGDIFRLAGRGVSKSLKKLYSEEKQPAELRAELPLLAAGQQVLWLWGHGFAEGFAPTSETRELLCFTESFDKSEK